MLINWATGDSAQKVLSPRNWMQWFWRDRPLLHPCMGFAVFVCFLCAAVVRLNHTSAKFTDVDCPRLPQQIRIFDMPVENQEKISRRKLTKHFRREGLIRVSVYRRMISWRYYPSSAISSIVKPNMSSRGAANCNSCIAPDFNTRGLSKVSQLNVNGQMSGMIPVLNNLDFALGASRSKGNVRFSGQRENCPARG